MVSTKAEVLNLIEKNKAKLTTFGVRKFSLFGSFVFDKVTDKSDVDLLVEFEPDQKTFLNFTNLAFFLDSISPSSIPVTAPREVIQEFTISLE